MVTILANTGSVKSDEQPLKNAYDNLVVNDYITLKARINNIGHKAIHQNFVLLVNV